jgi:acylphosphatase
MRKRLECKISGVVQGINFRSFARQNALMLELSGYVKNDSDGSVFLVAEGGKDKLELLADLLKEGPDGALVENMDVSWLEPKEDLYDFVILR